MIDEPYFLADSVVLKPTRRAVLVRMKDGEERWIPRSVCVDGDRLEEGDQDISVQGWWAEQEELL